MRSRTTEASEPAGVGATSWAVQLATLIAWRDDKPYTVEEALTTVGPRWAETYRRGEMLSDEDVTLLVGTTGLCVSPPQSPSAEAWEAMLRTYGPLCVLPDDDPPTFSPLGRVVLAIAGDGTPEGTQIYYADSASGEGASDRLAMFAGPLRLAHWPVDAAIHRGVHPAPPPGEAGPVSTSGAKSLRGLTRLGRALSTRAAYARATAVPDWDKPAFFPKPIRDFWGRSTSRLHHYIWHVARFGRSLRTREREAFDKLGFQAPAGGIRAQGSPGAGIDFLGMHHKMIETTRAIAEKLKLEYRPVGWDPIPWNHNDPVWPMPVLPPGDPNEGENKDPRVTAAVQQSVKDFFRNPQALARVSLDELGNRIEGEIHAWMHMHWSGAPPSNLIDGDPSNDLDSTRNPDWLGFFLSSQVNPIFWKLHGWVDDTINIWERATGQGAAPLLAQAWLGPVPQAASLSRARGWTRGMEADEAMPGMEHGELTDGQADEILAGLEPPTQTVVTGADRTREWLAALLGPDFEPSPEMVAAIEGPAPTEMMASLRDRRVAVRLDRHGVRQMKVAAAVEVGLAAFEAFQSFVSGETFFCETQNAEYKHLDTPPETPSRRTSAEFHLTTYAKTPVFPQPRADNFFYFKLMWVHNGFDIKSCSVEPMREKSSTLVKSKFTIKFTAEKGSELQDPVAAIRYSIKGRWNPWGPGEGDYTFQGELKIDAHGTADIRIIYAEENIVQVNTPLFSNVVREDLPGTLLFMYPPYVHIFPVNSDKLPDPDGRKLVAWIDGIAKPGSSLRRELDTKRTPIEVHGYASTKGPWERNKELADGRAARLASLLRIKLPNADIKAVGHGDVEARTADETEDSSERRAEVRINQHLWVH